MTQKKPQDLESLKKKAALIGIDVDALLAEITNKVAEGAIAQIMPKIEESLAKAEAGNIDIEKVAIGVAKILAPRMPVKEEISKQIIEGIGEINGRITANITEFQSRTAEELKVIRDTIPALIEQKQQDFRDELAGHIRELGESGQLKGGRGNPLAFLDSIPAETKGRLFEALINNLTGQQNQANIQSQLLQARLEGIFTGEKLAKGEATIRDAIGNIVTDAGKKQ